METIFNISDDLSHHIKNLPQDLKTHIYNQHLWFYVEKKPICDYILHWFQNSDDAQKLHCDDNIIKIISELLKNKTCTEYLRDKDKEFNKCYIDHFIDDNKNFILLPKYDSFVLSILMYKYH